MTPTEEKLIQLGTALARATGHRMGHSCPKISPAVPCTCGAAHEQAQALADWDRFIAEVKK